MWKIFAAGEYLIFLDCLVNIINNRRSASFTPRSEHSLKNDYVTCVTLHNK